jgi:RNA polymerase sigma-70 factor (ECF subfamily)
MVEFRMDPRLRARVDAHDVLQESFAEALARLPGYLARREVSYYVWVRFLTAQRLSQLHRRHLGALARDAARERGPLPEGSSVADAIIDGGPTPSRVAIRLERAEAVLRALEELRERDREVLVLRHFEGLTNAEAAQVLGVEGSTASVRYVRALRRAREILGRLGIGSEGPSG